MNKRGKYILQIPETESFANALSKARRDVEQLAVERGYKPFLFRGLDSAHGNRLAWVRLGILCVHDWLRLLLSIPGGSLVLVQYPHMPLKSVPIVRFFLPLIARVKRCAFVAFIHDLDSMRAINGAAAMYSDKKLLQTFQAVVCHNERMQSALLSLGIQPDRIFLLHLFDYLCDDVPEKPCTATGGKRMEVAFAGNLSAEKSAFLYKLPPLLDDTVLLTLYGNGYCEIESSHVQYLGIIPAQRLPATIDADFGLVWDGCSAETCEGPYGIYLALNNPHKVSLYLAAGIPVIIWSGAALAEFIVGNGLGVSIASLGELPRTLADITKSDYRTMRINAQNESQKVRTGYYFHRVLCEVEAKWFNE
ncbi:MAG: hypothetical protein ABFC73_06870 [Clostridiaceae bacterium]